MKQRILFFILLIVLFLGLRFYYISGNDVFFYYDQARDATVVTDMVTNFDLKIQGPSVSGTNDSVYHGVLYYYVIAPLYFIFSGNPYLAAVGLVFINLLGLFLTYKLGQTVFKSEKVGLVGAFLQSISLLSIHQSTWLSNPNLSAVTLPAVYLLSWKLFFEKENRTQKKQIILFALWGLSLAMSLQVALQNITLFGAVLVILFYVYKTKQIKINSHTIKKFVLAAGVFFAGISSMILTQILMIRRGILTASSLNLGDHEVSLVESVPKIFTAYIQVLKMYLAPYSSQVLFLIGLFGLIFIINKSKLSKKQLVWFVSFFTAPIWLLSWHFRDPNHSFIGLEILLSLVFANAVVKVFNTKKTKLIQSIAVILLVVFIATNISALGLTKENKIQYFGIQKGAFLQEQINLIETTYTVLEQPFTFSSLTAPYAINTTWDYLFRWYAGQNDLNVPEYVGIRQAGFVSQNVLPQAEKPAPTHALILEPDTTLSEEMKLQFLSEPSSNLQVNYDFGTLQLYVLIQERLHDTILE